MEDARAKFQQLLRDLFQFDSVDLDIGIYRIMNVRRSAINRFIQIWLFAIIDSRCCSAGCQYPYHTFQPLIQSNRPVHPSRLTGWPYHSSCIMLLCLLSVSQSLLNRGAQQVTHSSAAQLSVVRKIFIAQYRKHSLGRLQ